MKILLDTCTFLWATDMPERLSKEAKELFMSEEHEVYLSIVSIWELQIKYMLKKIPLPERPKDFILQECEARNIQILPLGLEEIFRLEELPHHHGDPFDRMLVCQALAGALVILTPDKLISQYKVKVRW